MKETAAGAENTEHAIQSAETVESDSLSQGSQINQNYSAGQNKELCLSKSDLYKRGKMESSSAAADAHVIQLPDINSGSSSSQGPQNQDQAPASYNFPDRRLLHGNIEETAAGAENPEHAIQSAETVESDSLSQGSQINQNYSAGQNKELCLSKSDLYKRGKMESSSAAADAHVIQLPDINSGSSSSQGPQNQDQAPASYNFPDRRLLHEKVKKHEEICEALRKAALEDDWEEASRIFGISERDPPSVLGVAITERDPLSVLGVAITKQNETALHVAIRAKKTAFAKNMLQNIKPEDLILEDLNGNTAFSVAVAAGNLEIVEAMLEMNRDLVTLKDGMKKTPLYKAVISGQKEMAIFLYDKTVQSLDPDERTDLFFRSIETDLCGIALELLKKFPELASSGNVKWETALHLLARKPSSNFIQETMISGNGESESTEDLQLLKHILSKTDLDLRQLVTSPPNVLFNAVILGNSGFLAELIRTHPSLVHELDVNHRTIFHSAVLLRQMSVFNLIHELGLDDEVITTYVDDHDNNILHLAAKYPDPPPPSSKSCAALEMQQELIIFQEFEKLLPPSLREAKNAEGLTPRELFTVDHRRLAQSGAEWMKSTASSCMVVATLIATVVFSAAFTVPGGQDDKTGATLLLKKTSFHVFAISDAIALSSSSFSILTFLSIITSGFAQTDFHRSLPGMLMSGMVALFMSIVSMMVTFTSNYFLVYGDRSFLIPVLTLLSAAMPIYLFVCQHYSLLRDTFQMTYRGFDSIKSTYMSSSSGSVSSAGF